MTMHTVFPLKFNVVQSLIYDIVRYGNQTMPVHGVRRRWEAVLPYAHTGLVFDCGFQNVELFPTDRTWVLKWVVGRLPNGEVMACLFVDDTPIPCVDFCVEGELMGYKKDMARFTMFCG